MTVSEIQEYIYTNSGIKTSVKKGVGSMKGYMTIWPQYQGGQYPDIPFNITRELKEMLSDFDNPSTPVFCSISQISVYGIDDDRKTYKKERKEKTDRGSTRTWGSKNSQLRLDKAVRRYARGYGNGKPRYN